MERRSVVGHQGAVHEGLFNTYTDFLIDLACGVGRYEAVHPYEQLDPARLTGKSLSCPACTAMAAGRPDGPRHLDDVTREYAEAVRALADRRGYPPAMDNDGIRRAFVALDPVQPPAERLYPLIQEHLAEMMTERARTVPEGTPTVLVEYQRYTGGTIQVPVGAGDRLSYDGVASGLWHRVTVLAVEETPGGIAVTVQEDDWPHSRRYGADQFSRWYFKVDRGPIPQPLAHR